MQTPGWGYLAQYIWIRPRIIERVSTYHYKGQRWPTSGTINVIGNTNLKGVPPSGDGPVHLKGAYATSIKTDAMPTTTSPIIATAPVTSKVWTLETSKIARTSEKRSSASDKSIYRPICQLLRLQSIDLVKTLPLLPGDEGWLHPVVEVRTYSIMREEQRLAAWELEPTLRFRRGVKEELRRSIA